MDNGTDEGPETRKRPNGQSEIRNPQSAIPGPDVLLDVRHLAKRYTTPGGDPGPLVLKDCSLEVRPGESVAIVGVSGSGKSTLLNLLGGLDRPTSGTVLLEGRDLAALDEAALAEVRNRRLGFVFQLHHLLPQCTALENVLVPTLALRGESRLPSWRATRQEGRAAAHRNAERGTRNAERQTRSAPRLAARPWQVPASDFRVPSSQEALAARLLERVGLEGRADYVPGRLSGGQRQRVAVARALINQPRLVLADEPTGSLDRETAGRLADLLVELNRTDGVALVVVTHSTALARRMGRCLELRDGRLFDIPDSAL